MRYATYLVSGLLLYYLFAIVLSVAAGVSWYGWAAPAVAVLWVFVAAPLSLYRRRMSAGLMLLGIVLVEASWVFAWIDTRESDPWGAPLMMMIYAVLGLPAGVLSWRDWRRDDPSLRRARRSWLSKGFRVALAALPWVYLGGWLLSWDVVYEEHRIPAAYEGPLVVIYDVLGAPEHVEGRTRIFEYDADGIALTSLSPRGDLIRPSFYYVDSEGRRVKTLSEDKSDGEDLLVFGWRRGTFADQTYVSFGVGRPYYGSPLWHERHAESAVAAVQSRKVE